MTSPPPPAIVTLSSRLASERPTPARSQPAFPATLHGGSSMIAHLLRWPARVLLTLALLTTGLLLWRSASPVLSADDSRPAVRLTLRPGDHICIIGNTLADRMQHDGWLETYLHSRFPKRSEERRVGKECRSRWS